MVGDTIADAGKENPIGVRLRPKEIDHISRLLKGVGEGCPETVNSNVSGEGGVSIREIAKHPLNSCHVFSQIIAASRYCLKVVLCTDVILAGPQVS